MYLISCYCLLNIKEPSISTENINLFSHSGAVRLFKD